MNEPRISCNLDGDDSHTDGVVFKMKTTRTDRKCVEPIPTLRCCRCSGLMIWLAVAAKQVIMIMIMIIVIVIVLLLL